MKTIVGILTLCLAFGCSVSQAGGEKGRDKKSKRDAPADGIRVVNKWELPPALREVSGIGYLGGQRFACIQDEQGTIFIYNTAEGRIEREIPFAAPGDYEGIALTGKGTAYVVRSDGLLFEVDGLDAPKSTVHSYRTPLTATHNIEGLCFDGPRNRLLLAVKDGAPGDTAEKGIYEFRLDTKQLTPGPVYRIRTDDEVLAAGKKKGHEVRPSGITRHPGDRALYILDGPGRGLMVMDPSGALRQYYELGKGFAQPEGIAFSPSGTLYISNEGKKEPANILEVHLGE